MYKMQPEGWFGAPKNPKRTTSDYDIAAQYAEQIKVADACTLNARNSLVTVLAAEAKLTRREESRLKELFKLCGVMYDAGVWVWWGPKHLQIMSSRMLPFIRAFVRNMVVDDVFSEKRLGRLLSVVEYVLDEKFHAQVLVRRRGNIPPYKLERYTGSKIRKLYESGFEGQSRSCMTGGDRPELDAYAKSPDFSVLVLRKKEDGNRIVARALCARNPITGENVIGRVYGAQKVFYAFIQNDKRFVLAEKSALGWVGVRLYNIYKYRFCWLPYLDPHDYWGNLRVRSHIPAKSRKKQPKYLILDYPNTVGTAIVSKINADALQAVQDIQNMHVL